MGDSVLSVGCGLFNCCHSVEVALIGASEKCQRTPEENHESINQILLLACRTAYHVHLSLAPVTNR